LIRTLARNRAAFDLAHLATLSDAPELLLTVSEQTQHLLNNLVERDIQDSNRYALHWFTSGYLPVKEEDKEYLFYKLVAEAAALQIGSEETDMAGIGFTEQFWLESTYETPSSGAFNLALGEVPAGENWRLQLVNVQNDNTAPDRVLLRFRPSGNVMRFADVGTLLQGRTVAWEGDLAMSEEQYVQMRMYGCEAGDEIRISGWFIK
jgi:hypothetical protein